MIITQRFFVELSYKGTNYHGWQTQPNAVTVQETLDKALSILFREKIETLGCGRTDTGVHARQFYAHFDVKSTMSDEPSGFAPKLGDILSEDAELMPSTPTIPPKVIAGLNALLPKDISVKQLLQVDTNAHARFDATLRSYEYHLHYFKDPFKQDLSWLVKDELDIEAMNEAGEIIKEYKDFSCFSKSNTQVFTNNCAISEAYWQSTDKGLIFTISADRFLRNMVRAIVGTMIPIGKGEVKPESIRTVIESKNRSNAGTSVPPCGLYLSKVLYPYIN